MGKGLSVQQRPKFRILARRILVLSCFAWFFAFGYIADIWGKKFEDISSFHLFVFYANVIAVAVVALYVAWREVEISQQTRRNRAIDRHEL